MTEPDPVESIRESKRAWDAAFGRYRRAYGKEQAEKMMVAVAMLTGMMRTAENREQARDQLAGVYNLTAKLAAIRQGLLFPQP